MVTVIERSSDIICSNSVLLKCSSSSSSSKRNKQESIAAATGFLCMNITCSFLCYVVWVALELIPSLTLAATSDHTLIAFNLLFLLRIEYLVFSIIRYYGYAPFQYFLSLGTFFKRDRDPYDDKSLYKDPLKVQSPIFLRSGDLENSAFTNAAVNFYRHGCD
uniref:Uncharacterized protein n=1 Tax=Glossina palpalis gambiensis TaxID=67801 RepID=A0A1B0BBX8_9MUSC